MKGPYASKEIPVAEVNESLFWDRVKIPNNEDYCWEWIGPIHRNHGKYRPFMTVLGRRISAKRMAWVLTNERQVPVGQVISQVCGNPLCVAPSHLEANTQSVAVSRGWSVKQSGAA